MSGDRMRVPRVLSSASLREASTASGPIVSADSDHTVPWAIANAAYKKLKRNKGVTEIIISDQSIACTPPV
jgi:hypothetical protein